MTKEQMLIAAKMCDDRRFSITRDSTPDEIEAGAWLFDNGIFYLGPDGCDMAAKMLREEAAKELTE